MARQGAGSVQPRLMKAPNMPTWQFQTHLNPNLTLNVPPEVAGQLRPEDTVHVLLMTEDSEERDWQRLAAEQFFRGYSPGDDVYDQLPPG